MKKLLIIFTLCLISMNVMGENFSRVRISAFGGIGYSKSGYEYMDLYSSISSTEAGINVIFFQNPYFATVAGVSYENKKISAKWSDTSPTGTDYSFDLKANLLTFTFGVRLYNKKKFFIGGGIFYSLPQGDIEYSNTIALQLYKDGKIDSEYSKKDYGAYLELGYTFVGSIINFDISTKVNFGQAEAVTTTLGSSSEKATATTFYLTGGISFDI